MKTIKEIKEKYAQRIYSFIEDCVICPQHDQDTILGQIQDFIYDNIGYLVNEIRRVPNKKGDKQDGK